MQRFWSYFPIVGVVVRDRRGAGWPDTMSERDDNLEEDDSNFTILCDDPMEDNIFELFKQTTFIDVDENWDCSDDCEL